MANPSVSNSSLLSDSERFKCSNDDCIPHTSFSKSFIYSAMMYVCNFVLECTKDSSLDLVPDEDLLERLSIVVEMCSSSRHTVSYLLSSEFATIHDFLLKTLASFNDPSKHVNEMTSKLLSIYCTATNNAEYADDSLTKSNFYEPLIELCLSSFIWMDPNIMESAFSLLHHSAQNSTRHCAHIRHYFCDNENMPATVDFVFKNSLRPAMLNNLWLLMESLLSSKDDPASDDEVQLYLPILAENISQLITSIDSKNNPPTSAIISFAKILICARTHHSETSSNDLLQIGNQFKDALENIIMNFDAKLCQADKSQMEECQLFYNELQRQI